MTANLERLRANGGPLVLHLAEDVAFNWMPAVRTKTLLETAEGLPHPLFAHPYCNQSEESYDDEEKPIELTVSRQDLRHSGDSRKK